MTFVSEVDALAFDLDAKEKILISCQEHDANLHKKFNELLMIRNLIKADRAILVCKKSINNRKSKTFEY